ncbi:hypothetical protein [Streptomyces sp. NPDC058861]|uniref:hypothetical protein n=1 Tax=Streptomyces sp. NPDC058861 TaxID=3346653 RepID=UPI003684CBD1
MAIVKVKTPVGLFGWLLRLALWVHVLVSVPLYLGFLHHVGGRWGQLPMSRRRR